MADHMNEVTLYVDTNSFIQLRDLKDLPWRELIPGVELVNLVVARVVVDELDGHKTGTNRWRRDRARAALRLIDAASEDEDRSIVLRYGPVRVVLSVAPRRRIDFEVLELDPTDPDDRLVAAASVHGRAALLSHDSGPRITARDIGLKAYQPPEDWLLPAEQSDEQRRLAEAERRIKALQDARPDVEIEFPDEVDGVVVVTRLAVPPLAAQTVGQLVGRYRAITARAKMPRSGDGAAANVLRSMGVGYSDDEIALYEEAFAAWERNLEAWAGGLHERIMRGSRANLMRFNLHNRGMASAERLVVKLEAADGVHMLADERMATELFGSLELPEPPKPPERGPRFADPWPLSRHVVPLTIDPSRTDPTVMTWMRRPTYDGEEATYGCMDFRPGADHADALLIAPVPAASTDTSFTVTVSANHMNARSRTVEVRFQEVEAAWNDQRVLGYLPVDVARIIGAAG